MYQRKRTNQRGFSHHLLLPLFIMLIIGGIGAYLTFASQATEDFPKTKRGLVDDGPYVDKTSPYVSQVRDYLKEGERNPYAFAITKGGMRHTVLNVGLRELVTVDEKTRQTTYIAGSLETRIQNAVKWNSAHPKQKLTVHVRFHVGNSAPEAWKNICGRVTMTDPNFNVTAVVPRWWVQSSDGKYPYRDLYSRAMKVLAPAVSAINASPSTANVIGTVNVPAAAPNYPEPMIIYATSDVVRGNLLNAGFTAAEHNKFMLWVPQTAANFKNVGVELALNPYQNIDISSGTATYKDVLLYQQMGDGLITAVGDRAVLANYSARSAYIDNTRSDYGKMYLWMASKVKGSASQPKVWAGIQMARPQNTAQGNKTDDPEQWDNVARWAAGLGFHFAETTGPGSGDGIKKQPGLSNIWPKSYHDDSSDIGDMLSIRKEFLRNTAPW